MPVTDPTSNLIWLALEDAITAADSGPYWPGIAAYLRVEDRNGRIVVVSEPGYTGQTTEPVVGGRAFMPMGGGYPETFTVRVGGLAATWARCPLCGVYASLEDRPMHYSIMGHVPMGCVDCRPASDWHVEQGHDGVALVRTRPDA